MITFSASISIEPVLMLKLTSLSGLFLTRPVISTTYSESNLGRF